MTTPTLTLRKRTALIGAVALLAIGAGGVAVSGAYFTDQKSVTGNSVTTPTVALGDLKKDATTPYTFENILPIADSEVDAKASTFTLNVANSSTTAIDWAANVTVTSDSKALAGVLKIQYSTDNGQNWSGVKTLDAFKGDFLTESGVKTASTTTITLRAWLPSDTPNTYQGATLKFDLRVRAIQTGAGISTDSNFPKA